MQVEALRKKMNNVRALLADGDAVRLGEVIAVELSNR